MENSTYDYNYSDYDNYTQTYESSTYNPYHSCDMYCVLLVVVNVIISLLGVSGNGVVIWISGLKMKKTVNTTWYLNLAICDFVFCVFLPFNIVHMATGNWVFGLFMCKLFSFVIFLNMFSSIFLLTVISIDRCVSVLLPVWAQNQRTLKKAAVVVVLMWVISAALSTPSMIFRDIKSAGDRTKCLNNYDSRSIHKAVILSRFVCGFVIPFSVIISSYLAIVLKLRSNQMARSTKPFKVMSALIATFFICWLPYHIFVILELNHHDHSLLAIKHGLQAGSSLASANSFLNPILYVFMGNDFKQKFKFAVFSKMANAMGEDDRTSSRYFSRSSSVDRRVSTVI